ncbi:MAG: hypothetical protein IT539_14990 [Bradyrhizobiaceae bacterium]|nr:hypothetical protein [Bradyrhizobiaceae bacterium]
MTKLLEQAIAEVRKLPEADQDMAAEMLLSLARKDEPRYRLTPEQIEEVKLTLREVREGKIATDEQVVGLWRKCGL